MNSGLVLRGVGKTFGAGRRGRIALSDVDLEVVAGEFVCVVGASGSGKSTLINLIAGLDRPDTGVITLDGSPVRGPAPERGLVCQDGALFPWRTVAGNVGFGLELAETGLSELATALPGQLSGGQRQRVAIARALAGEPRIVLLDEPFGALDVQTKEDMQVFLRQVWQDTQTTVVLVTHDIEEAVFLGQRVVVLASDPGRIAEQVAVDLAEPRDLATKRTSKFLALRNRIDDLVRAQHRLVEGRC
jgi:NitT/TauT family transport system ATP-binding protein